MKTRTSLVLGLAAAMLGARSAHATAPQAAPLQPLAAAHWTSSTDAPAMAFAPKKKKDDKKIAEFAPKKKKGDDKKVAEFAPKKKKGDDKKVAEFAPKKKKDDGKKVAEFAPKKKKGDDKKIAFAPKKKKDDGKKLGGMMFA